MKRTVETTGTQPMFTNEGTLHKSMVDTWKYAVSYKALHIIFFGLEATDGRSITSIHGNNKEVPGRMKTKLTKAEKRLGEMNKD